MKIGVKILLIISLVIVILVGTVVYMFARKNFVKIPGGGGDVPRDWDPTQTTVSLHDTMAGLGTEYDRFFAIMDTLTKGQIAMIYNRFLEMYGDTLISWIEDDFSGNDLSRALKYFDGIPGIQLRLSLGRLIRGGGGGKA